MHSSLRERVSLRNPAHFLALGFGSGLAPKMPGTFGSLAALPLIFLCAHYLSFSAYLAFTLIASVVGIWVCGKTAEDMGVHDDSSIVWDEVAGMLIAMLAVPFTFTNVIIAFALFRFFDILKPWPISVLDKNLHGGLGIMLDDIAAGAATMGVMHLLFYVEWI
ncbi:phosphatidylglycerophosphatase A [Aliiglaciecola litoralis]|uniref:Phosphatidylglycerophosphatase A n=1 Tax=Aliiglaciecola litoralis TaxID=582857 RepID=A0ABN1LM78_9ALTE